MESATKRVRTHDFQNDEEAEAYIDSLLFGKPQLPLEIWVKILSSNPALSVQDIQRMCRVNSLFKELCDTGIIWDEIFKRQFGLRAFRDARTQMPDDSLARLFTIRFMKIMSPQSGDGRSYMWKLDSPNKGKLQFQFEASEITNFGDGNDYREIQMDFLAKSYGPKDFEFVQQFARDLIDHTFIDRFPIIWQDGGIYVAWSFKAFVDSDFEQPNFEQWIVYYLFKHKYYRKGGGEYVVRKMQLGQCVICDEIAEYVCGKCKDQLYCGQECAQKDWEREHYKSCNK